MQKGKDKRKANAVNVDSGYMCLFNFWKLMSCTIKKYELFYIYIILQNEVIFYMILYTVIKIPTITENLTSNIMCFFFFEILKFVWLK